MSADLTISPLKPEDRASWDRLWTAYLAFYNTTRPAAVFDATFARYTDPERRDMNAWLAWQGDRAVGLVHSIAHPHGWSLDPVTYLQDLYADPEVRGLGIGRKLIEAVYADADAAGRPAVYWLTQIGNTTARQLYDRIATPTDFMKYNRA